ncbi:MAG: DUF3105 domain-containing protein [Ilumatobacteraceae bacterium]|nr:DUF3105 domain-containing protein [Ilumatobacteraceae bacterium]
MHRSLAALLGLLLVCAACADDGGGASPASDGSSVAVAAEPEGTQTFTDLERTHVDTPVDYPQTPPVGGPHNPVWQTCGFYDVEFPKERGVHSMEHGAVWITHAADLPAADVAILQQFAETGKEVLVSPFSGLPAPVVASAWGKQLQLDSVTDPRLAQFVGYFDDGPQTPEIDTPCAQGTDATD